MIEENVLHRALKAALMILSMFSLGMGGNMQAPERNSTKIDSSGQDPNIYEKKKLYLSMAGSGGPWKALTKERRSLLRALHDGLSLERLADIFGMSTEEILFEIKSMQKASLVKEENGRYIPTFFIASSSETQKVYSHSKSTGKMLAETLFSQWDELERSYSKLSISSSHPFKEQAFMLVGSRLLDIGLLGALSHDKSLLTPSPSRPSPGRPDSRYYFWMVEGELEHLGKYGQSDIPLPQENWYFLTFGQSWICGKRNEARKAIEEKYEEIMKSNRAENPESIAKDLNTPLLTKKDSLIWRDVTEQISDSLLNKLKAQSTELRQFFRNLKASQYAHNSFGEFFCWYIHLAYNWAIDTLIEKRVMNLPPERFSAIILYREGEEGVLF
jgi:hypothetical protein